MAIADNKRRLDRLERRIEILEDELGVDHSNVIEAGDDGEIVTDGGELEDDLPQSDGRDPGDPVVRLRQAIKQVRIVRTEIPVGEIDLDATLGKVEFNLRGAADYLEEKDRRLDPSEIVDGADDEDVQEAVEEAGGSV